MVVFSFETQIILVVGLCLILTFILNMISKKLKLPMMIAPLIIGLLLNLNIVDYQKAADLIISRAGAGAISEISALGKASVLIPKRGLPGDHQELNAIKRE